MTLYLPSLFKNYSIVPIISNISQALVQVNDSRCTFPDGRSVGSSFAISLDYLDGDGNINVGGEVPNKDTFTFLPSGEVTSSSGAFQPEFAAGSTSSAGQIFFVLCIRFVDSTSVRYTISIADQSGAFSNPLSVDLPKPAGANATR